MAFLNTIGKARSARRVKRWPDQATAPIVSATRPAMMAVLEEPEEFCILNLFIETDWAEVAAIEAEAVVGGNDPYRARKDQIGSERD